MITRAIIVGTDGTDASAVAVDWAAREAHRRHLPLRIVHALDWDSPQARYSFGGEYLDIVRQMAESVVAAAVDRARGLAPDVTIDTDIRPGHAVAQLLAAAHDAELLVLGSRGRGGFSGLLLGSVSQRLATHAPCPVVVVRGEQPVVGAPIAVGVDDSPAADLVLETAFTAASEQHCLLSVVHTYLPVIPLWLADVAPPSVDTPEQDAAERARLTEQLAPWRAKFPDVVVESAVTHESAAFALQQASQRARLVVIGNRGHGRLAGTLLGSTTLQLLHHAACPVLVVRPRPAPKEMPS